MNLREWAEYFKSPRDCEHQTSRNKFLVGYKRDIINTTITVSAIASDIQNRLVNASANNKAVSKQLFLVVFGYTKQINTTINHPK